MNDDFIYVRKMLESSNLTKVSKLSKVPYRTVLKLANGKTKNPSFITVKKLADFFKGEK